MKKTNSNKLVEILLAGVLTSSIVGCGQIPNQNISQNPSIIWSTGEPHEARAISYGTKERLERKREFFYRGNKSRIIFYETQDLTNSQKWCVYGISGTRDADSDELLEILAQKLPKLAEALRQNKPINEICFENIYDNRGHITKVEISLPDGAREKYIPEQNKTDRNPMWGIGL